MDYIKLAFRQGLSKAIKDLGVTKSASIADAAERLFQKYLLDAGTLEGGAIKLNRKINRPDYRFNPVEEAALDLFTKRAPHLEGQVRNPNAYDTVSGIDDIYNNYF